MVQALVQVYAVLKVSVPALLPVYSDRMVWLQEDYLMVVQM